MDQNEEGRGGQKRGLTTIAVVVVIVLIAVSVMLFSKKEDADVATTATPSASPSTSPAVQAATAATDYKDGSYDAKGTYSTPGGTEAIQVTLTVKGGSVVASNIIAGAENPEAKRYQADFISGYKQFVEGKQLNDIAVSNVSGSSLTPKGFADALRQIQAEAKA